MKEQAHRNTNKQKLFLVYYCHNCIHDMAIEHILHTRNFFQMDLNVLELQKYWQKCTRLKWKKMKTEVAYLTLIPDTTFNEADQIIGSRPGNIMTSGKKMI